MALIYLDVTSSCKSPLNTGVQRVVRGIYRELCAQSEVVPLLWSPGHRSYCRLSPRELGFLENPFTGDHASAIPEHSTRGPFWIQWWRHFQRKRRRLILPDSPETILFVPEIFQDNRIDFFRELPPSIRTATVFYDAITWKHPELSGRKRQENFETYLKALGGFNAIFAISRESKEDLELYWKQTGSPSAPVSVEYLPGEFQSGESSSEPDFSARRILLVSTLERRKNHLTFLEACEHLWEQGLRFEVELVGRMAKEGGQEIGRCVEELQKKGRAILWLQHVDDAKLEECYQRCSFTVYPSLHEGFGMPILESLWHHRPCVCGSNGALGEVAAGGGCVAVNQSQSSALAEAMRLLLENENYFKTKVAETTQRDYRSWQDYGRALSECLQPVK